MISDNYEENEEITKAVKLMISKLKLEQQNVTIKRWQKVLTWQILI